jgi:hypothetical protein
MAKSCRGFLVSHSASCVFLGPLIQYMSLANYFDPGRFVARGGIRLKPKGVKIWGSSKTTVRRQILDSICLKWQVSDVTLVTSKRKPFDFFVERLDLKKSRGDTI